MSPRGPRGARRRVRSPRAGSGEADGRRSGRGTQPDGQHAAGDADGRATPLSRLARARRAEPAVLAGHSLGEYTALVAAGALSLSTMRCRWCVFARRRCRKRCRRAQGAMAAILGLDDDAVRAACAEAAQGEVVEAVNFNSPGQVVIAGHAAAVERACDAAKAQGRQARGDAAGERAVPFGADASRPRSACGSTCARCTIQRAAHSGDQQCRRAELRRSGADQGCAGAAGLPSGALGRDRAGACTAQGVTHIVECGPGKVLAGLDQAHRGRRWNALRCIDRAALEQAIASLRGA